jgi:hypothetical protein
MSVLFRFRRCARALFAASVMLVTLCAASPSRAVEVQGHPRLWITAEDLPHLRQWADASNPIYQQGLRQLALQGAQRMDSGALDAGDNAGSTWTQYASEDYAALFALMALIDPDTSARPTWAQRGRTMLMRVIDSVDACQRANPPNSDGRFCQLSFPVSDRSRWSGHAFPLATDWLQAASAANGAPILSDADLAKLRRVFLIWSRLSLEAYPNPYNNPPEFSLPVGTVGEPLLRLGSDTRRHRLRFSGNNYYAGHMRNMAMRALALDAADDHPDAQTPVNYLRLNGNGDEVVVPLAASTGALRHFLVDVIDGWLFVQDYLLRHDSRGGLPQEGLEYAPTSIGIPTHLLLALDSAGFADVAAQAQWGEHVAGLHTNPFYRRLVAGMLHSFSPRTHPSAYGTVYKPAWYGDGEQYYQPDPIDILGPLALHAMRHGDHDTADAIRWVQRHVPPDGSGALLGRARAAGNPGDVVSSIVYFLLFDPGRASSGAGAPDPRPAMPRSFWSDGMGRLLARTDWSTDASLFAYRLGYNAVDHQHGDGGMFDLYRRGEWLTRGTLGYGNDGGASDYKNTVTIENVVWAGENPNSYLGNRLRRGAQMPQGRTQGDPVVLHRSEGTGYAFVGGDATPLYNAHYFAFDPTPVAQRALDVVEASRDVFWLQPDTVVVYDRMQSASAGRRKRFWLNLPDRLPAQPVIAARSATSRTPGGQRLSVTSVLPAAVDLSIVSTDTIMEAAVNGYALGNEDPFVQTRVRPQPPGGNEKYATRLVIEAAGTPLQTRLLTVIEGGDGGSSATPALALASTALSACATPAGAFDGVALATTAVWFGHARATLHGCVELAAPAAVDAMLVSGLQPFGGYALQLVEDGAFRRWQLRANGPWQADAGGVLRVHAGAAPQPAARLAFDATEVVFAPALNGTVVGASATLRNEGNAASGALSFQVQADPAFALDGGSCVGMAALAPQQSCSVQLRFAPDDAGLHQARLQANDAGGTAPAGIDLVGHAQAAPDAMFRSGFEQDEVTR